MMIDHFRSADDGYAGSLRTLLIDAMIRIVPAQLVDSDNAPAWRVLLGETDSGVEVGAGWNRTGERAGPYAALQIDDPVLGLAMRVNPLRSSQNADDYHLFWSRPSPRERS